MIPEDHLQFLHAVWERRPVFTYIFFGLNILIFLLMSFAGGSTNQSTLLAFGVKENSLIAAGQWWRFVTPIFIHIGIIHLCFNSYALWIVGPQVEKLYGGARFVILYVLTGVAGVYGSYFYHPAVPSAGASGAIFGLFGVLLVFGIRYRNTIPFFARAVGTGVLPVIVVNLIIGFTMQGLVDNAAHIGGLIAGAALAAVVPFQKPNELDSTGFRSIQFLLIGIIAVCFYQTAAHYNGPRLAFVNLIRGNAAPQEFLAAMNSGVHAYDDSVRDIESGHLAQFPKTRSEIAAAIDKLKKIPSLSAQSDRFAAELLVVMQEQYALLRDIQASGNVNFATARRLVNNNLRYKGIMDAYVRWLDTEGSKYGIESSHHR